MIGLDTSFLVALTIREHQAHTPCLNLFEAEIRGRDGSIALAPQVLAEFAHVITDQRRFTNPLDMNEAIDLCDQWWHARECFQVITSPEATSVFLGWMTEFQSGRKQIPDTILAASYYSSGIRRLATTNWRDFNRFNVFEVLLMV